MHKNKRIVDKLETFTKNGYATQTEIAKYCGCSQAHISRILSGESSFGPDMAEKILTFMEKRSSSIKKLSRRIEKITL